jgi:hypothetical protein
MEMERSRTDKEQRVSSPPKDERKNHKKSNLNWERIQIQKLSGNSAMPKIASLFIRFSFSPSLGNRIQQN